MDTTALSKDLCLSLLSPFVALLFFLAYQVLCQSKALFWSSEFIDLEHMFKERVLILFMAC